MHFLPLILLIFFLNPANAEIRFSSQPTGMSETYNYQQNNPGAGFEIAGGLAGDATSCSGTGTCDTCTGEGTITGWIKTQTSCNKKRITLSTVLTFQFLSTAKIGKPTLSTALQTGGEQVVVALSPTTATNQTVTITTTWGAVCGVFDENATSPNCNFRGSQTFKIGIDGNTTDGVLSGSNDDFISFTITVVTPDTPFAATYTTEASCTSNGGFCNFSLEAGDEKAYINDLNIVTTGLGTTYKYVYFFCAQSGSYDDIVSACTDRILISGANALQQDTITGIPNGIPNVFRAATVDVAGNIGLFLNLDSTDTTACPSGNCQTVTPQDVLGLFDENSCFVATAAYGSPMQKNVKTLRRFRDQVLRKTSWGQIFIKTYYALSPSLARWISQNSQRRSAARFFLTPIVFVVTAVVDYPWLTLFFIISMFGGFFCIKRSGEEPS